MNDLPSSTKARPTAERLSFSALIAKRRGTAPQPGAIPRPTGPAPRYSGVSRVFVLGVVAMLTIAVLIVGGSWLTYRYRHLVLRDATIKGRVARIGARIDAQVAEITAQPGQRVSKGEVVIRLEDQHLQAAVRRAQSALESVRKRHQTERLAVDQERRRLELELERCQNVHRSASGELEATTSTHQKLDKEHVRVSSLVASGAVSASEMDQVQGDRDNARARIKVHEANLAEAEVKCRAAQVELEGLKVREAALEVLAAEVDVARDGVVSAEADLAATVIRAPEDGWVIERIIEPGGSAKVGEPMLSLWTGTPWVEAWADEDQIGAVRIGSRVEVAIAAFPDEKVTGWVEGFGVLTDKEMASTPVPSSLHTLFPKGAMVPIRIRLPEGRSRWQPGLSAIVGIRRSGGAPAVPTVNRSNDFLAVAPQFRSTANK